MTALRWTVAALLLMFASRSLADISEPSEPGEAPLPGKNAYIGPGFQENLSRVSGWALPIAAAYERDRFVALAEFSFGRDAAGWGTVTLGVQLGGVLSDGNHAPYVLAGLEYMTFTSGFDPFIVGRTDTILTGEAGIVFWRAHVNGQLWLGLRGLLPLYGARDLYATPPPALPYANLVARILF